MKKKMIITGVSGLLGNNLAYCLKEKYDILGLYNAHGVKIHGIKTQKVDLIHEEEIRGVINSFKPDVIVHCAALSDIDYCESHQELAYKINVLGTKAIVDRIKDSSIKMIYISTDSVYGVSGDKALKEDSVIDPSSYYGITKFQAEQEVSCLKNKLIFRTNLFGWNVQKKFSLAEWVIYELSHGHAIKGFHDVYFSSIYTFDLADILDKSIKKDIKGVYNCGTSTTLSKHEFANRIAKYFDLDTSLILPSSVDNSGLKAKRRKQLVLDVSKIQKDLNIKLPTIERTIQRFFEDYKNGVPNAIQNGNLFQIYPKLNHIPYSRQCIDEDDIEAVVSVLKSRNLTQGPKVVEFENELARTSEAEYAAAVNSGTSALHLACLAAGVVPQDEVITSTNTFVASANCIVFCGAKPVFTDIDPRTYNMSPVDLEKKITSRTKAVIPVHFAGQSCDMAAIDHIIKEKEKKYGHKIYVIEDASHALGSIYRGSQVGSCKFSDMATMSFHPVKHITTGEGGAVLTNQAELAKIVRRLRSHGITSDPEEFVYKENAFENKDEKKVRPWYYEQQSLGYNYRTTDISSALGLSQLKKLPAFAKKKWDIVQYYNQQFRSTPHLQIQYEMEECISNFHLYVLLIDFEAIGMSRIQFMNELKSRDILTQVHYIPVHTQPFYRDHYGYNWGDCPHAEEYYSKCLSIPLYPELSRSDLERIVTTIKDLMKKA